MRLLGVELGRFRSRRGVVITLLVAAGLAALMVVSAAYATRPPSATERATAQDVYEQELAAGQKEYRRCLDDPQEYYGQDATAADCESSLPRVEWFLPRGELDLATEVDGRGTVLLVLLAMAAILAAATFSGADWASGSMSNQLLFQPRRVTVWLAKAAAVVVGTTVCAA